MTHRERILTTLSHQEPDRVPIDLGGTGFTTLVAGAHQHLREYLGLPVGAPTVTLARRFATVIPDEAIMRRFHSDARPLLLGGSDARPEQVVSPDVLQDEWGVTWTRPPAGHFITTDGPLHGLAEPTLGDLRKVNWPDPADPGRYRGLRERAQQLHEETETAVILGIGPGPIHLCHATRGFTEWLEDLLLRPAFAEALLDLTTEFWIQQASKALELASEFVDLVTYGDDIGGQRTTLFRPELYRRVLKPRQKRMVETVKRWNKAFLYHTCGSVYDIIPDLIDIGIDALNPVQVAANKMDTHRLKKEFGHHLTFWGAIDTQKVLPTGTPEDVRQEVRRRVGDLAEGGGYVLATVHNIQDDVPPENIVAMFEAALEFGRYGG